jgi:hypothetical protein
MEHMQSLRVMNVWARTAVAEPCPDPDSQLQVAPGALFFLKIREAAAVVGAIINRERLLCCSATTLQSTDTSQPPAA